MLIFKKGKQASCPKILFNFSRDISCASLNLSICYVGILMDLKNLGL